jgi:adenine-specific DNA-methyltransferase
VANQESNGRFHSDWLSMMYPRLKLAWVLLKYDGVIFISIDDNEVHNLRKMCDEVLSKANFIAEFPRVTKKAGKSADIVSKNHDYVLAYRKTDQARLTSYAHVDSGFKHSDEHIETRGTYKLNQTLDYGSIQYSPSLDYEIKIGEIILRPGNVSQEEMEERKQRNPKSAFCWRWSRDLYQFGLANDFIVLKESRNGYRIYTKTYKNATIDRINGEYKVVVESRTKTPTTLDFIENKYSNDNSRKDMANLFDLKIFEYAKPVEIPMSLSFLSTEQNDIILDFFSGSATTAHAVMQLNAEDGGNRRFIMVQLPEVCDEKSEAFKAGYKTICEIGKERIRRAGREIKEENATNAPNLDVGFRVFKLDSSNMKDVYYTPDALDQKKLDLFADAIKEDRTAEDLLFQVFLDSGLDLALPVTKEKIDGKTIFTVDQNVLVACFASDIPESLIRTLAKRKPLKAVFLDRSFAKDSTKLNVTQIFKQLAPGTEVKTI